MAFTYDSDLLSTSELYQIRLEIGDTNEYDPLLEDAEVQRAMDLESSFYARCARCCKFIIAKLSKEVDHTTGTVSEKLSQLLLHYRELKSDFAARGSESYPWMRSISKADKETNEEDTDRVKPSFKRGMHDIT